MTIVSTNTVEQYAGDGVQTEWPVTFPFHRPEDVRAVVTGVGGDRVLTYGTDYAVAVLPGGGGSVTTTLGAPGMVGAGERLTLWLDQPFTQEMDLRNTGVLDAEMLERSFDRLTLMAQQLREEVGRCVKVPLTDQATRSDELLAGIAANVGRAEMAALNAEARATDAGTEADRAGAARADVLEARDIVDQVVADARNEVLASAAFVPIGAILDFPVHTVPMGFLLCAGQEVTKEAYPELVAYLNGDALALSATLPDLRGEFRRGADLGRGVDAGRAAGSAQGDAIRNITGSCGTIRLASAGSAPSGAFTGAATGVAISGIASGTAGGVGGFDASAVVPTASENRPRNIAVVSCIKAYHAPMSAAPVDMSNVLATLDAIRLSGAEAKQPQTILRCRMKSPMAAPFHELALPDFLSFSGLVVTLLADPAAPFAACFGNGGVSVASEITGNLSVALPGAAATHWLYVERNPDTGALALGATETPPEYGSARRGVAESGNYAGYEGKWGTVSASSEYAGGGSPAWKALDGNATNQAWYTASGVTSGWWRLTMNRKRRVRGYEMVCENDALAIPRAWNIKVTHNGVQATVDSVTGAMWSANERKRRLFAATVDCDVLEVECLNSGREYTGMTEFAPIFDEDWYSPPENIMRRADGVQVQRVYVGKAVVSGGVVAAVTPFAPGVEAVVPLNGGNALAASTTYVMDNPLGAPVFGEFVVEGYDTTSSPNYWVPCGLCWTGSQYMGVMTKTANQSLIRLRTNTGHFWWGGDLSFMTYAATRARVKVRRAF